MADALVMKTGDTDPGFRARLQSSPGLITNDAIAMDLTLATTAKLKIAAPDGTLIVNSNAVIEPQGVAATKGYINHPWVAGETDLDDGYRCEVTVTWTNGTKRTFPGGGYGDFVLVPKLG